MHVGLPRGRVAVADDHPAARVEVVVGAAEGREGHRGRVRGGVGGGVVVCIVLQTGEEKGGRVCSNASRIISYSKQVIHYH